MTDAHGVARDQLRAFIERIERLEEEKKTIADDIKDVYGEAKGMGYDTKIMKMVISLRKKDEQERTEQELILDTYLQALGMIPDFDPDPEPAAPRRSRSTAMALQSPRKPAASVSEIVNRRATEQAASHGEKTVRPEPAASFVEEIAATIQPETATKSGADTDPGETAAEGICEAVTGGESAATISPSEDGAVAEVKGMARLANVVDVEPSSSAPIAPASHGEAEAPSAESVSPTGSADANTGGIHVDAQSSYAAQAGAAVQNAAPATPSFTQLEISPPFPMKRSSFAHCFPELSKAAYDDLFVAIDNAGGIEDPIIRQGDVILDGWARFNIARGLGDAYPVQEYAGNDALLDVISWQRSSRDWTPAQEAKIARDLVKELPERADDIWAAFHIAQLPDGEVVAA